MTNKTTNKEYIEELQETIIPELELEVRKLSDKKEALSKKITSIRRFSVPFDYNNTDICSFSILGSRYGESWEEHKTLLHRRWSNETTRHTLISSGSEIILYYVALVIWDILSIFLIFGHSINQLFGLNKLASLCASYALFEILVLIVSTWYYVFRPNMINKSEAKKELKEVKSKLKVASNDLQVKQNIVEQYKLATINPNKEFAAIKKNTTDSLRQIVDYTTATVIPNIKNTDIKDAYAAIMQKCYKLLDMANENGAIVTEISKIYNIYINDINNVLVKLDSEQVVLSEVYGLLNNFSEYVDRKIKKFSEINTMSLQSEINALVNSFKED